ncbi:tudor and KH domain-containing protein homolog isoform X2 [Coccinella septempunctata]|uniref:tudor and KH domain-containing protein homolog isoform X1 n=1 Tax=Coccinella septempunctata TaxID=41139 RepID=UPI001D07D394|nr:tudor and KH domain-containing protein homolog isoform X1 [Coccinella septempunctata]XP_044758199.1 tudor and KH domain-containing protein homolog isoform X2 [Coccinella septempunctata]
MQSYKNLAAVLGLSLCGISLYLLRKYWKKDEDDTLMKTSNFTSVEMVIPPKLVREVIGKEGCNIKKIEVSSGTRIHFRHNEGKRICIIRGTTEACHIAKTLIQEFIGSLPKIEEDVIHIPRGVTPRMIGRGGENIHEIQNLSGAKINISQESGDSALSKVTFTGTKMQLLEAKALFEDKLQQCIELNSKLQLAMSKREPRAPPKCSPTKEDEDKSAHGEARRESLSQIIESADSPFEVYVSALVDPSKFWIQIFGPKAAELDRLVEEMTEFYYNEENRSLYLPKTIKKNDLVAAVFKYDSKWYRAEVLSVDEVKKEAQLHYVDYGDTDFVEFKNILELRTDFLRLHFQAIECYLHNIEPVNGKWSEAAVDKFEEWTYVAQWKNLSAKIKDYTNRENKGREGSPVPGIDLYDCKNGKTVSIADKLVDNKFACYKKNQESKSNEVASSSSDVH